MFLEDVTVKARADVKIDYPAVEDFRSWLERYTSDCVRAAAGGEQWVKTFEQGIEDHAGNVIRVSGPRAVLFDDFDAEIDTLFREWVAPRPSGRNRAEAATRDPLGGLRREAQSAIMRIIRKAIRTPVARRRIVSDYEIPGRVHRNKFDVAIVPPRRASSVRLFHHVLVLPDSEESYDQAAALARRWIDVRERSGNHKSLTAVFYSRTDTPVAPPEEATALLKHDKIQAASLDDLVEIASDLDSQTRLFPSPRAGGLRSGRRTGRR